MCLEAAPVGTVALMRLKTTLTLRRDGLVGWGLLALLATYHVPEEVRLYARVGPTSRLTD